MLHPDASGMKHGTRETHENHLGFVSAVGVIESAEATFAAGVLADGVVEVLDAKVGPIDVGDVHLGIADLPEEIVGDAPLPGGADQQIRIGQPGGVQISADHVLVDVGVVNAPGQNVVDDGAQRVGDFGAGAVVQRDAEREPGAVTRGGGSLIDFIEDGLRQAFAAPQLDEADIVLDKFPSLFDEVLEVQVHQRTDFSRGPFPVLHREGIERQGVELEPGALDDDVADGLRASAMPGNARLISLLRPSTVAVHDDRDMPRPAVGRNIERRVSDR